MVVAHGQRLRAATRLTPPLDLGPHTDVPEVTLLPKEGVDFELLRIPELPLPALRAEHAGGRVPCRSVHRTAWRVLSPR